MLGGKSYFTEYISANPGKFFSASEDEYEMSCHPEAFLNKEYKNANTYKHAKIWDKIYSCIFLYLGNLLKCQEAVNIINNNEDSWSYELLKKAAVEKNKRTSECLLAQSTFGMHAWQQPDFIKKNRQCQLDLPAHGMHLF